MSDNNSAFSFEISLSTLNHLGRQLYRSFATVLGEAISNAWDADATEVRIAVEPGQRVFWVRDDGVGMDAEQFQKRFLRIGYSKRKDGKATSAAGRPFIGRKGIGKLALLSCAERITVVSKVRGGLLVGGTIDNSGLDKAILDDLTPQEYPLEPIDPSAFAHVSPGLEQGTVIRFEGLKDGTKKSFGALRETIALYFRFSLIDKGFKIYLNDVLVTHADLGKLVERTQFLWRIGTVTDPLLDAIESFFSSEGQEGEHETRELRIEGVTGFIGSVNKPKDLKLEPLEDRLTVDLFVNGRLRERDVLKHIPTARVVESYLYGQLHYNSLDDATDRFTSSREGVVADDPRFEDFLVKLRTGILKLVDEWDDLRRKKRDDGDSENPKTSKTRRASESLYNAVTKQFQPKKKTAAGRKVEEWIKALDEDAAYNFESYAECFVSENLIRKYIVDRSIPLSTEAQGEVKTFRKREVESKGAGNVSFDVRRDHGDLGYLSMDGLANLVDKPKDPIKEAGLSRDAKEFKPMRDAVAHTALLTDLAKARLSLVRENIKSRIGTLLGMKEDGGAESK